jgi:hypothetical protein
VGQASLGTLIGALIALPFVAAMNYFQFIEQQAPERRELVRASHGAGIIALPVFLIWFTLGAQGFTDLADLLRAEPKNPAYWVPLAIPAWGLLWLVTGWHRAAKFRDARIIARSLVKIAIGAGVLVYLRDGNLTAGRDASATWGFLVLALYLAAVWCTVTGATKIFIVIGGGGNAMRAVLRSMRRRNAPLRPANARRWWQFWK